MTKSAVSCGFGHIYWKNPWWTTSFFCSVCFQCFRSIVQSKLKEIPDLSRCSRLVELWVKFQCSSTDIRFCLYDGRDNCEGRKTGNFRGIFRTLSRLWWNVLRKKLTAKSRWQLLQKAPSYICESILNTPLSLAS